LEIAAGPFDPSGVGDASRLAWVEPGGEDQTLGRGRGCVVCPETPKPARASGFRVVLAAGGGIRTPGAAFAALRFSRRATFRLHRRPWPGARQSARQGALALPLAVKAQFEGEFFIVGADGKDHRALLTGEPPGIIDLSLDRKSMILRGSPCGPDQPGPDNCGLVVADVHGHQAKTIVPMTYREFSGEDASWSPDGKKIAFERYQTGIGPDVWVVSADGTSPRRLVRNAWLGPWSPDSRRLAFVQQAPGPSCGYGGQLQIMRTDGTGRRVLTRPGRLVCPGPVAWSPSGRYVAYVRLGKRLGLLTPKLFVADLRLRRSRLVGFGSSPTWSPDDQLTFLRPGRDPFRSTVTISRANGTHQRTFLKDVRSLGSWSPNGQWLAVVRVTDPVDSLFALEIRGRKGRLASVLDRGRHYGWGSTYFTPWWTPDSRRLVCLRRIAMI